MIAALTLAVLAPAIPAEALPAAGDDLPLAPDGRRGLGGKTPLSELLKLFRTPDEEEENSFAELEQLEQDVRVLEAQVVALYRSRDFFTILEGEPEETLPALHDAYRRAAEDLEAMVFRRDATAEAFARMHLDPRFRVRMGLLQSWEQEAREVRRGLAVLRAASDGFVALSEPETENVATRVDLSAALLRALRKDLEALRELPGGDSGPSAEEVAAWFDIRTVENPAERLRRLEESKFEQARRASQMRQFLFGTQLEERVADLQSWRERAWAKAQALRAEARFALPEDDEEKDLSRELERLTKTERRRLARAKALEGLSYDPLDDELAYLAAVTSRIVHGTVEALSHYDRFLSLRGIRYHDDRTYRRRELTWEEADALLFVQETILNEGLGGEGGPKPPPGAPASSGSSGSSGQ